jgi:amino acid transporter
MGLRCRVQQLRRPGDRADPWRALGKVFWSTGWILVFLAICNSIAANSNAAVNAATRVFYALSRNRLAPPHLGRIHPQFKTPYVAIIWMSVFAFVVSLILGWKWGPLIGFAFIATLAVIVVVVYILICLGCIWHYWTRRRAEFNWFLPERLRDMERVYVEDETVAPETPPATMPT